MSDYPGRPQGSDGPNWPYSRDYKFRLADLPGLVINAIGYALVGVATLGLWLVLAFPLILLAAWAVTPLITLAGAIL